MWTIWSTPEFIPPVHDRWTTDQKEMYTEINTFIAEPNQQYWEKGRQRQSGSTELLLWWCAQHVMGKVIIYESTGLRMADNLQDRFHRLLNPSQRDQITHDNHTQTEFQTGGIICWRYPRKEPIPSHSIIILDHFVFLGLCHVSRYARASLRDSTIKIIALESTGPWVVHLKKVVAQLKIKAYKIEMKQRCREAERSRSMLFLKFYRNENRRVIMNIYDYCIILYITGRLPRQKSRYHVTMY